MRFPSMMCVLVVCAAAALGQPAPVVSPTPELPARILPSAAELTRRIEDHVRPLADGGDLSGTLLVARGDAVLFEESFGKASFELNVPNTPTTRFCVASITKPMTTIIATRLLLDKKLARGDNVAKWFPDFPKGEQMTVEHLMKHRAGIPHRVTTDAEETIPRTAAEMVKLAARQPLAFEPGTRDAYSSAGYTILAAILERASGKPYAQLLDEIVARPVGATRTSHVDARRLVPERAQSYFRGRQGPINASLRDLSFLVGAGSVFSTPKDLFAISRGLVKGSYGDGAQTALIRENGLRWNGITNGFRAFLDYHEDQDLTVIFAGNLFTGAADLIRQNVPQIASGEVVAPAAVPRITPKPIAPALMGRVEGTYRLRPGSEEELRFEEPLMAALGDWLLIPTGSDTFFSPQDYAEVKVLLAKDGSVEALQWGEAGKGPRFERVRP